MSIVDTRPRTIYALLAPDTSEVRYVGQAINVWERYRLHLRDDGSYRKARWIQSLRAKGQRPGVRVLAIVQGTSESDRVEDAAIALFRSRGCRLTNGTNGGRGARGLRMSAEARALLSAKATGRKMSDQFKANVSARFKGKPLPAEHRSKISQRLVGRTVSAEARAKMSASAKARVQRMKGSTAWSAVLSTMAAGRERRWTS